MEHTFEKIAVAPLTRFNALTSLEISRILKKNWKNQALFYFKNLNKVHHGTAYRRSQVRNPYSFTDKKQYLLFQLRQFIRGYHVYMKVRNTLLGECLFGKKKPSNGVYKNAVAVIHVNSCGKEEVVDHVPQSISKVVSSYPSLLHCYVEPEVTELEILAMFRFYRPKKSINYFLKWSIIFLWKNSFVIPNIGLSAIERSLPKEDVN